MDYLPPSLFQGIFSITLTLIIITLGTMYFFHVFGLVDFGSGDPQGLQGFKIITTSGWIFFTVINAFYGGALTMFFTSLPDIPFEDFRGAVAEYPDWKIIYLDVSLLMIFFWTSNHSSTKTVYLYEQNIPRAFSVN